MLDKFWIITFLTLTVVALAVCKPIRNCSDESTDVKTKHEHFKNIHKNKVKRLRRQVVQPTWLTNKDISNPFIDSRVRVTEQNLRETEAIRKAIQAAVDADTFVVNPDQSSKFNNLPANEPTRFTFPETTNDEQTPPNAPFSFFPIKFPQIPVFERVFSAFQRAFSPFVASPDNVAATAQDTVATKNVDSENKSKSEFKTAWLEFMANAKNKWPEESAKFEQLVSSTRNLDETVATSSTADSKPENKPKNKFQQAWLDFFDNSKEMVSSIPPAETEAESEFMEEFENLWTEFEDNFMKIWTVDIFA